MGVDTTTVGYLREVVPNFFSAEGLDTGDGDYVFQIASAHNANVTKNGTLGWRSVAALITKPAVALNEEYIPIESGFIKKLFRNFTRGVKASIPLELCCVTYFGKKFVFNTDDISFVEPSPAISTTIDTSTAPTRQVIKVDDVTGFEQFQRIAILTDESDKDPYYELKHIRIVDTDNDLITLEQPLEHLPENGAAVKVIESEVVEKRNNFAGKWQGRLLCNYNDHSVGNLHFPLLEVSKSAIPGGDGQNMDVASIELAMLADWSVDSNGNIQSNYFSWERIHETTGITIE